MRLLVVEDEIETAENLKQILELQGNAVDVVNDGADAETRIALYHKDYDLIVLDLDIPTVDGMTLTRRVRADGVNTPIIILTGMDEMDMRIVLLNSGADDYMIKPFLAEELIARITSILRRPVTTQKIIQTIGDISVNISTHKVYSGDREIFLTLKEYALLECFLRSPGEVLTREQLSDKVWDFNAVTHSNVLDSHMKNLRKKIQSKSLSAHFETVRGVGYRLVV